MGLVLNPQYKMREDSGRAILFSVNPTDMLEEPVFRFLYPQHAVMLSLFDGKHTLSDIKKTVAYLFGLDPEIASKNVENLLDLPIGKNRTIRSLITDTSDFDPHTIRKYNPKNFIVPVDEVDMEDLRCRTPCSLLVLPTMRCFTDCVYCYADRKGFKGTEFDLEFYKKLLCEAKECGIETVEFSGGDFFCRKDAFELIECTLAEDMYLNIPTKYPLSRDEVNRLAKTGLATIQISIDALSPDIIDRLMQRNNYGKRILNTLDYLGEAGLRVRTNSVLTPYNIHDALNLARHLAQLPYVFQSNFNPYGRSLYRHDDRLFCSEKDLQEFKKEFMQIKEEFPDEAINLGGGGSDYYIEDIEEKSELFWDRSFCTANKRGVVVLPDGKVTICEELYFHDSFIIGNLTQQSLMEIWNSPRALELAHPDQSAVPNGACKTCPDFVKCHEELGRCFRETLKAYGYNNPQWPDPRCPRAPVGNRVA